MSAKRKRVDWSETVDFEKKYQAARASAQAAANADGFDRGLERNDLWRKFSIYMLPNRDNRYGHETRCEVVSCEDLDKTQPGHGYK